MLVIAEHGGQSGVLAVGEETGAGVQRPAGAVERIGDSASVTVEVC